jgi:hypothetical protein
MVWQYRCWCGDWSDRMTWRANVARANQRVTRDPIRGHHVAARIYPMCTRSNFKGLATWGHMTRGLEFKGWAQRLATWGTIWLGAQDLGVARQLCQIWQIWPNLCPNLVDFFLENGIWAQKEPKIRGEVGISTPNSNYIYIKHVLVFSGCITIEWWRICEVQAFLMEGSHWGNELWRPFSGDVIHIFGCRLLHQAPETEKNTTEPIQDQIDVILIHFLSIED